MHQLVSGLILVLVCAAVAFGIRNALRASWINQLHALAIIEENRNRFGALRTDMLNNVRAGKLDVRSEAFIVVHACLTALMRHPERHRDAALQILRSVPEPQAGADERRRQLTVQEVELLREFSALLDLLCRDFNTTYRWLSKVNDRASLGRPVPLIVKVFAARERRRSPERDIRSTKSASERLHSIEKQGYWPTQTGESATLSA